MSYKSARDERDRRGDPDRRARGGARHSGSRALAQGQAALEAKRAALAAAEDRVAKLTEERDLLRASHERLRLELELLRKRVFVAKAERVDTAQLEMEFAAKLAALDRLGGGQPPAVAAVESEKRKPTAAATCAT